MSPSSSPTPLAPAQEQVLDAIVGGASISQAADKARVHRNTVANWRRSSPLFRDALQNSLHDRAMLMHEQAVALFPQALKTIEGILTDPLASASVRLKAALAILNLASTPPTEPTPTSEKLHKNAQREVAAAPLEPLPSPQFLHKNAQPAGRQSCTILHNPKPEKPAA